MKTIVTSILVALAAFFPKSSQAAITLTSFEGTQTDNSVVLSWTTQSEQNNQYFHLEVSSDGVNFSEIAHLNGAGTSDQPLSYSWTDNQPVNGNLYYRLSSVNFNGQVENQTMTVVPFEKKNNAVALYPNPAMTNEVYISFPGEKAEITIRGTSGRIIMQQEMTATGGTPNLLPLPKMERGIGPTILYVTVASGDFLDTQILVIQ